MLSARFKTASSPLKGAGAGWRPFGGAALLLILAGCSASTQTSPQPLEGLASASEAGARLSGRVVDLEMLPVGGASVEISGPVVRTTATNAEGNFSFEGLEPGSYALKVKKVGYKVASQKLDLGAGQGSPVSIILEPIAVAVPRHETYVGDGYLDVAVSAAGFSFPFNVTGTPPKTGARYQVGVDAVSAIAFMTWNPSLPGTSKWMSLAFWYQSNRLNRSIGASPLLVRTDDLPKVVQTSNFQLLVAWGLSDCGTSVQTCTTNPDTVAQIAFQQRLKIYTSVFYVEKAPEAYRPGP